MGGYEAQRNIQEGFHSAWRRGSAVIFSSEEVLPIAESTGFRAEMIEKVLHLLNLLDKLNHHPMLKGKWVLKGGTALNLFMFDLPRLSVDIDLNTAMLRQYSGIGGSEEWRIQGAASWMPGNALPNGKFCTHWNEKPDFSIDIVTLR